MSATADEVIKAISIGVWQTADLVRLAHAVATRGVNTTSVLARPVRRGTGGTSVRRKVAGFDTKAYDVRTPADGDLQVKTFSLGKRAGSIRSFTHYVITLEVDPATAQVVRARRYAAADLYKAFWRKHHDKYEAVGHGWGGAQTDRFERGWTIGRHGPFRDLTELFNGTSRGVPS